mgnify:CR=1 FL=1
MTPGTDNRLPERDDVAPAQLPALLDELGDDGVPVVIRGLASTWPAVMAARDGAATVSRYLLGFDAGASQVAYTLPAAARGRVFYGDEPGRFNFEPVRIGLRQLLAQVDGTKDDVAAPTVYMGSTDIHRCLPGFMDANPLPLGEREALVNAWIGNRTVIAAHYDMPDNIAVVVAGRRRFTLFPPDQRDNLYIGPLDPTPSGQEISLVDFESPDFEAHPRFREALHHARIADLEPGDAIYIPGMWWHHVRSGAGLNMLVNAWWRTVPAWMGAPVDALKLALLNLRGLPAAQRRAWRDIFASHVFAEDDEAVAHLPPGWRGVLGDIDEQMARRLRAELLNRLKR